MSGDLGHHSPKKARRIGAAVTRRGSGGAVVLLALLLCLSGAAPAGTMPLELRADRRFSHDDGGRTVHRAPVALNDDHDCGQVYRARRFWDCGRLCPDGGCDHRTLEPVWDFLYVGGRVDAEDDLLAVEMVADRRALPPGARVRLAVVSGGGFVRLWPDAKKGRKGDILPADGLEYEAAMLPEKVYVEGVKPGSALLRLSVVGSAGTPPFELHVDVVRLVESQKGERRVIYNDGTIDLRLEPEEAMRSAAYAGRIVWTGHASGEGSRVSVEYQPGDLAENRRIVFRPSVSVAGLELSRPVRVRQRTYTGSPVAQTTPERRREVESLLEMPRHGLLTTALPNKPTVRYSQAWFEKWYTGGSTPGDPVKPINQVRLQYAPKFDREKRFWGVACFYLKPYGVFITDRAYESGLKLEDLRGVAHHELRHLTHYLEMHNATGLWHVLCRDLEHPTASLFMEADASSASLKGDSSWRYLHHSAAQTVKNYRQAARALRRLPSLPQRTAAIKVLQDIYAGLPADMDAFKRPDYDCHLRPPREIDEERQSGSR